MTENTSDQAATLAESDFKITGHYTDGAGTTYGARVAVAGTVIVAKRNSRGEIVIEGGAAAGSWEVIGRIEQAGLMRRVYAGTSMNPDDRTVWTGRNIFGI